ncbi:MAG: PQQ-binding-like beta-propeller repeat protein, partial [Planctomycetales bacterium]
PGSHSVNAYDPKTGEEIWKARNEGYSTIPRPVYGHGLVFICTGYDAPVLLAIRPTGKGDVTDSHIAWDVERGVPHTSSLLLVGKELYMVSDGGVASCVDAMTGENHWRDRLEGGFSASPIHAGGKIYFLSEKGVGSVYKASKTMEEIAVNELGERTLASYAVGDGALFIRAAKHLYRLQSE